MRHITFLLLLVSYSGFGQIMEEIKKPGGYQWKAVKGEDLMIMPSGPDTPAIGNIKFGVSTKAAYFYKTADSSFWVRSEYKWNKIGNAGSGGSGPTIMSGTILAPSGSITIPAGKLIREIILHGAGVVSVGLTPGGGEISDANNISGTLFSPQYIVGFSGKFPTDLILYITTEEDITYEIYLQ